MKHGYSRSTKCNAASTGTTSSGGKSVERIALQSMQTNMCMRHAQKPTTYSSSKQLSACKIRRTDYGTRACWRGKLPGLCKAYKAITGVPRCNTCIALRQKSAALQQIDARSAVRVDFNRNCPEVHPVKMRAGICFASTRRRDIAVADAVGNWIRCTQFRDEVRQNHILHLLERQIVRAFEFDANREIIATISITPLGFTCMPGARPARHELNQLAIATDEKVRRNASVGNFTKVGVSLRIKTIGKQLGDRISTKAPGWQADVVNHKQLDGAILRARIAIRGSDLPGATQTAGVVDSPAPPSAYTTRAQLIPRRSIR